MPREPRLSVTERSWRRHKLLNTRLLWLEQGENGEWIVVPNNAVVSEPNKFGPAVVWPYMGTDGQTQIRCFLPGTGV